MRGAVGALALLAAVSAFAQETPSYTTSENPYQGEYTYTAGQPIVLRVEVGGVRFDTLTLSAPADAGTSGSVSCTLGLDGSNQSSGKVTISAVVLLEDDKGRALERLSLAPFRVKRERPFTRTESLPVGAASLAGAARLYVFLKVD